MNPRDVVGLLCKVKWLILSRYLNKIEPVGLRKAYC